MWTVQSKIEYANTLVMAVISVLSIYCLHFRNKHSSTYKSTCATIVLASVSETGHSISPLLR